MVRWVFKREKSIKAPRPDNIKGQLPKECSDELADIFPVLFNSFLSEHMVPSLWKTSEIRLFPKENNPAELNDYCPVALTSVVVKCLERLIPTHLRSHVDGALDPMQFEYIKNRSVEDAVLTEMHSALTHMERPHSYV